MLRNNRLTLVTAAVVVAAVVVVVAVAWWWRTSSGEPLRVAMAPYQDNAMLVNYTNLKLDQKYRVRLELRTTGWEDIPPAVASAGRAVDVGFGSYIEYLTKYENLNAGTSDPVLFLYPAYVFKGGAFVSFNPAVPALSGARAKDPNAIREFLKFRIGAQRHSIYDMMLFYLARLSDVPRTQLRVVDTPLDQGFLAAQQGSLDAAEAGLTQLAETARRGGRTVLTMDDLGFADLTGFIARRSVYEKRRRDIDALVAIWFECVDHVFSDLDRNSNRTLAYLDRNASTRYTLAEFKNALSQEYFPRSIAEADRELVADTGRFAYRRIGEAAIDFLVQNAIVRSKPPLPQFISPRP